MFKRFPKYIIKIHIPVQPIWQDNCRNQDLSGKDNLIRGLLKITELKAKSITIL